jgi:hypothetical protein
MFEQKTQHGGFWPKWSENKLFTVILTIILVYGIVWMAGQIRNDYKKFQYIGKAEVRDTISIEGEGKVIGVPDVATVDVGIMTENKEVVKAQAENTNKMNALIAKIKGFGVDTKDIQTTNYSIYPQYDWPDGKQVLRAYQVSQSVRIKIRDLGKIGAILGAAGESGANQVSGVSFTIDDPEVLRQQAREKALDNAFNKVSALAKKAKVRLGKLVSFSEYSPSEPYPYLMKGEALGIGGGGAAPPTPSVETGSLEVKVNVAVTYEIL